MTNTQHAVGQLLNEANEARQAGRYDVAAQLLAAAREQAPNNAAVLNASGMHMLALQEFSEAKQMFAAAAAADPRAPVLLVNLATACRGMGDDEGERSALQRALALDRRDFIALLRLAELDERQGRDIDAAMGWSGIVQMASSMDQPPPLVADALQRGTAFIARHNASLAAQVENILGAKLSAMGAGARRISACLDHSLGRRRVYANQCEGMHFPFLPADEFFDRSHFPWLAELEAHTPAIRREVQALLAKGNAAIRPYVQLDPGTPQNKWTKLDQNEDWSACFLWEYGKPSEFNLALCPQTAAAIGAVPQNVIPGKAPSVFFSILKPKSHIPAHTGVTNTRAIIHLPLVVPDGCRFRVGGETRVWKEGEAFAFDDTIEHEAWNDSDEQRIVLILDVWNPHMTADECELVADFLALTGDTQKP
jgi:aspartyl/asparaginyl beta-hydroxylase (cupin superfamily)